MATISLSNRRRRCLLSRLCFHSGVSSCYFDDTSIIPTITIYPLVDAGRLMLSVIQRFEATNLLTPNWRSPLNNMGEGATPVALCPSFDMTTGDAL